MATARWAQRRREIEKEMHDRKCQRLPLLLRFIEYCIKFRCLRFLDLGTWRWVVYWSLVKNRHSRRTCNGCSKKPTQD